MITLSNPI